MEQKITGREIALFIAKFRLWDAYLDTDIDPCDGNCIDLRAPGYGCNECSYALFGNGEYTIDAWDEETEEWETVKTGDIYEEDRPKSSQM